jgi:hypothetical protein
VLRLVSTACKLLSHRAQRSGTGGDDSSHAGWIHFQCNYIKSEITPLHTLLWHCARSLPLANISRPQQILAALTCPSPFALDSAALHYAALHPSSRRPSLPPFTTAALHPSFRHSSPFTPPPFTAALHCRRPSRFIPPPFTSHSPTLHSRPSLRRPSLFTPTLHYAARTTSPRRALARPTGREQLPRFFS